MNMDYLKYFDHAPTGMAPENRFQFNNDASEIWKGVGRILFDDYVKDELGNWIPQGENKVQFVNDFLDYHFSKYKGAPEQFFFILRSLVVEELRGGSRDIATNKLYSPIIEKWIEKHVERNKNVEGKYVLTNESVILKLFEEYGSYFPSETKDIWKLRWIDGNDTLSRIEVDNFKVGNNKHLILTILHQAHFLNLMKVDKIEDYTKRRWGLKYYHRDISIYLNDKDAKPHPETKRIKEILNP